MYADIINEIDNLLLTKWDPIHVNGTFGAENEYSHYAPEILMLIENSDSYTELFAYLVELECEHMGLRGNIEKTKNFSILLFNRIKGLLYEES